MMSSSFDIMQRPFLPIGSFCLDASAGTGKTFSIENFISRKLLESELSIEQFLVVTFTRAAAFELKVRILKNLEKRLLATQEEPAQTKLKQAIANFDLATVTTIHSFCFNALKEYGKLEGVPLKIEESEIDSSLAYQALADFFQSTEICKSFTKKQLEILLKEHSHSPLELAKHLVKLYERGSKVAPTLGNLEIIDSLTQEISHLKKLDWNAQSFLHESLNAVKQFKEVCNRTGEPKEEILAALTHLSGLFLEVNEANLDKLALFPTLRLKFLKENLKAKGNMPDLWLQVLDSLAKYIIEWTDPSFLLLRSLSLAIPFIQKQYQSHHSMNFTDLLLKVESVALRPDFQKPLRARYGMVIIDEFQDTDPVQWRIFQKIFFKANIPLMLVGDPKQSIYAFRSADIYTYLEATHSIEAANRFFLDVNYRSSKELIDALNALFSEKKAAGWISLPKLRSHLPYPAVKFPELKENPFQGEAALTFLTHQDALTLKEFEADYLFPFFTKELVWLQKEKKLSFKEIAFLVRDHAQAERLAKFLRKRTFPVQMQRATHFSECAISTDLFYLLKAILQPKELNALLTVLGTRFFRFTLSELADLKESQAFFKIMPLFIELKNIWQSQGLYGCLKKLLLSLIPGKETTVGETLLRGNSRQDYEELFQLIAYLVDKKTTSPEALFHELENLIATDHPFKENLRSAPQPSQDAIRIMTLHMSKGLEFEVVFALGVMNRQRADEDFMMVKEAEGTFLKPIVKNEPSYLAHLEESDAEKARQLYVALTRAKYKLYVPLLKSQKSLGLGEASPLELFLAKRAGVREWEKVYTWLNEDPPDYAKLLAEFDCRFLTTDQNETSYKVLPIQVEPPKAFQHTFESEYVTSFTQLAKPVLNHLGVPRDFANLVKNLHTLPAGSMTGELIHQMIEEVPLEIIKQAENPVDLYEFVARYTECSTFRDWAAIFAEILFKAYSTPLIENIALSDLEEGDFFKECEFLFAADKLPFCSRQQKKIKGVIDFAFRKGEEIYLIDWKSNWLGENEAAYTDEAMQQAMEQHQYEMQATIYLEAFNHYLKKFPKMRLKGIFYFFLRGGRSILKEFIPT